ncbi:MAG TPA: hypothetical protein ENI73_01370 [Spirochaetes bacterium]|nr:hypothetical protein [Spirochaetota bacterium]
MTASTNKRSKHILNREFKNYVENYTPFSWDNKEDDPRSYLRNKHAPLISYKRFCKVTEYVQSIASPISSVVDVGPYPGTLVRILREFLKMDAEYCGIGLGFTDEYRVKMKELNATLFETDIDPDFIEAKESKDWPCHDSDVCFFLDAIEHLTSPIYCLDQVNKALKMGGHLIITTDNITCLGYTYRILTNGKSPNVHPLSSSMFYRGEWRPHFREYSKDELMFYLSYCGFKVIKHEYFEREQGDYCLDDEGRVYKKPRYSGVKGLVVNNLVKYIPHLRDHHILIAEKIEDYNDNLLKRPKPTHSMSEWIQMRSDAKLI